MFEKRKIFWKNRRQTWATLSWMDNTNRGDEEKGEGLQVYLFQKFAWAGPIIGNIFKLALIQYLPAPSSSVTPSSLHTHGVAQAAHIRLTTYPGIIGYF